MNDFLVIGAGLAGLAFTHDVVAAGATAVVLDKGRGVGGRMATRRMGELRVDHGAQFFTARTERFQAFVAAQQAAGVVKLWTHGFPLWQDGAIVHRPAGHPRYACSEGMSSLPKALAAGLTVETSATVTQLERGPEGYTATTDDGRRFSGKTLILNLPPTQLLTLAEPLLDTTDATRIREVAMNPCWALLVALEADIDADWPALELSGHPVFGWIARDHTRRAPGAPPVLVAHAHGDWTRAHLELERESVLTALHAALHTLVGPYTPIESAVHRWRYAQPLTSLAQPCLWDAERNVGVCGDWCEGGRVEGAVVSGWTLAAQTLGS